MSAHPPFADAGLTLTADSRVLVIGTIGAGKSHFISRLVASPESIQTHSIDDCRRENGASTRAGEEKARETFLRACAEESGIFECTGAGPLYKRLEQIASANPFDCVVRLHAPSQVCVDRVTSRHDWPPYPITTMPDSALIDAISKELDSHGFDRQSSDWNGQRLLHVSGVVE
jgi:predicted kinase